jgi:hypothetical protein
MRKPHILILVPVFAVIFLFQFQTTTRLRRDLAAAKEENGWLHQQLASAAPSDRPSPSISAQAGSNPNESLSEPQKKRLQELESEVMRLRGAASRALRAEAEVAQLKARIGGRPGQGQGPAVSISDTSDATSTASASAVSNTFLTYLGEAVPAPPNIDPAYSKDGLVNAISRAAELAGVSLKKLQIETSEFPFLAGVICESDADFEKLKEQFKTMTAYEYGGATSSHGTYAFNITPHSAYPSDAGQRISRRTTLRQQILFDQLMSH